jgi:hypothetical protein
MACVPGSLELLRIWAPQFAGRIGAHLQLTDGRPCSDASQIRSLVDKKGAFPGRRSLPWPFNPQEVAMEWRAQIQALRDAGLEITHLDSHHHVHRQPELFLVYRELAREYGLSARTCSGGTARLREAGVRCADHCETGLYCDAPSLEVLLCVILRAKLQMPNGGLIELVSHPGHVTEELHARSVYVRQRPRELEILTTPDLSCRLAELAIELVDKE